jgi:hypothetical protein
MSALKFFHRTLVTSARIAVAVPSLSTTAGKGCLSQSTMSFLFVEDEAIVPAWSARALAIRARSSAVGGRADPRQIPLGHPGAPFRHTIKPHLPAPWPGQSLFSRNRVVFVIAKVNQYP